MDVLRVRIGALAVVFLFGVALREGAARPEYLEIWKARYPQSTLPARVKRLTGTECAICHDPPGPPLREYRHDEPGNCYRETLHVLRHEPGGPGDFYGALLLSEELDSDADGVPNREEILFVRPDGEVGYHPGLAGPKGRNRCGEFGYETITGDLETPPVALLAEAVPPVLAFGGTPEGAWRTRGCVLRNRSARPVTLDVPRLVLGGFSGFSVAGTEGFPAVLPSGGGVPIEFTYLSSPPGYFYQNLAWCEVPVDSGRAGAVTILLRSSGSQELEVRQVLAFPVTAPGQSVSLPLRVSNPTPSPVSVRWILESVPERVFVVASRERTLRLEPGEAAELSCVFSPWTEGEFTATLELVAEPPQVPAARVKLEGRARRRFSRGDANGDGRRDVSDAVAVLRLLFDAGPPLACPEGGDFDDDGVLSLGDAVNLLTVLYRGEGRLPPPCVQDLGPTYLGCGTPGRDCGTGKE